jgi:hypothetical protein
VTWIIPALWSLVGIWAVMTLCFVASLSRGKTGPLVSVIALVLDLWLCFVCASAAIALAR